MIITLGFTDLGLYCHLIKVLKYFVHILQNLLEIILNSLEGKTKPAEKQPSIHFFCLMRVQWILWTCGDASLSRTPENKQWQLTDTHINSIDINTVLDRY